MGRLLGCEGETPSGDVAVSSSDCHDTRGRRTQAAKAALWTLEGIQPGEEQGDLGHVDGGCRGRRGRRLGHPGLGTRLRLGGGRGEKE